ncbi:MAG TPA: methylated-DNA--[protein]-cysteine S-methyltransferase [Nitrospira sp.]|nr:methylated-DNA--[protein]-cysteine S-methyltransferase [Nitrospira sp.]
MRRTMIFKSRWGWMGVVETENGIATIVLPKASRMMVAADVRGGSRGQSEEGSSPGLRAARKQLTEYLAGRRTSFTLPLDLSAGTAFQRRVWRALQNISYGYLHSYQELAALVGGPQYARAVGNAVGANPLPIVIPCHRIVSQDGSLGGFSCGLPAKRRLLALEGSLSRICRRGHNS